MLNAAGFSCVLGVAGDGGPILVLWACAVAIGVLLVLLIVMSCQADLARRRAEEHRKYSDLADLRLNVLLQVAKGELDHVPGSWFGAHVVDHGAPAFLDFAVQLVLNRQRAKEWERYANQLQELLKEHDRKVLGVEGGETGVSYPATTEELASPGSDRPVAMIDLKESPPKETGSACLMLGILGAAMDGSSLSWIVAIAWGAAAVWVSLRLDDWKQRARDAESATKREGSRADGLAVQLDIAQRANRALEGNIAAAKAAFERMRPAWEFLGITEHSNIEKSLAEMRRFGEAIYAATSGTRPDGEESAGALTFYGLMSYGSQGAALLRQAETLRQERDKRTGGMPESEIKIRSERLFAWVALRRGETRLGSGRREDFAEGKALGEREGLSEAASAAVRILLDGATVDANGGIVPPADYKTMEAELPKPIAEQMADSPPKSVPGNQAALWLMLGVLGDTVVFPDASSMTAWGCGGFAVIVMFLLWLSQRATERQADRASIAETRIVTLKKMIRGEVSPTTMIPWPQVSDSGDDYREAVKSLKLVLETCSGIEKERDRYRDKSEHQRSVIEFLAMAAGDPCWTDKEKGRVVEEPPGCTTSFPPMAEDMVAELKQKAGGHWTTTVDLAIREFRALRREKDHLAAQARVHEGTLAAQHAVMGLIGKVLDPDSNCRETYTIAMPNEGVQPIQPPVAEREYKKLLEKHSTFMTAGMGPLVTQARNMRRAWEERDHEASRLANLIRYMIERIDGGPGVHSDDSQVFIAAAGSPELNLFGRIKVLLEQKEEFTKVWPATSSALSEFEAYVKVATDMLAGIQPIPAIDVLDSLLEPIQELLRWAERTHGKAAQADATAAVANRLRHEQTRISRFALEGTGAARDEDSYETKKAFDWIAEQKSYRAAVDQLAPVIVSIAKKAGVSVREGENIHLELLQNIDRWLEKEISFRDEAHQILLESLEGKCPGVESAEPMQAMFAKTVDSINQLWRTIRSREDEVRDCNETIRAQTAAIQERQRRFDEDMAHKVAEIETAGRLIHGMLDGQDVSQQASFPWVWGVKNKIEALRWKVSELMAAENEIVVDAEWLQGIAEKLGIDVKPLSPLGIVNAIASKVAALVPGNQPLDLKRKPGHGLLDEKTDRDRMDELELQANGTEKLLRNALTGAIDKTQYPCFRWAPAVVEMVWRLREQIKIDGKVSATVQAAVIEGEVGIAGNEAARAYLARILSIPDSKSNWDVICTTAGKMINLATGAVKQVREDWESRMLSLLETLQRSAGGEKNVVFDFQGAADFAPQIEALVSAIHELRKHADIDHKRAILKEIESIALGMDESGVVPADSFENDAIGAVRAIRRDLSRKSDRIVGSPEPAGKPWPVPPMRKLLVFEEIEGRTTVDNGEFYSTASGGVRLKMTHGTMDVESGMKVYRKVDPMDGLADYVYARQSHVGSREPENGSSEVSNSEHNEGDVEQIKLLEDLRDKLSGQIASFCNEASSALEADCVMELPAILETLKGVVARKDVLEQELAAADGRVEGDAIDQLSYVGTPGDGAPETLQLLKVPVADLQRVPDPVEGLVPMGDRVNAEMLAKVEEMTARVAEVENSDVGKLTKRVESLERIEKDMIERDQKRVAKIKSLEDSNKRLTGELEYLKEVATHRVEGFDLPEERFNVSSETDVIDGILRGHVGIPVVKSMQEQGEDVMRAGPASMSREIAYMEDGTFFEIERFTPSPGDHFVGPILYREKTAASNRWTLDDGPREFSVECPHWEYAKPIGVRQKANEVKAPDPTEQMRPGRQAWFAGTEVRFLQIVGQHAWIERENGETDTVDAHRLRFKKPE